jgi:hypothetical protein
MLCHQPGEAPHTFLQFRSNNRCCDDHRRKVDT